MNIDQKKLDKIKQRCALQVQQGQGSLSLTVNTILMLIEDVEQATNGWIPCSERLPEKEDANEYGNIMVCWDNKEISAVKYWMCGSLKVTHWMPLPEPPATGDYK